MARQLIIELVGKDTTLSKSLDDADKKVGGFSTSLGGAAKAAGALIGGGAAISFLKASTEQATEAAQAQSQLENALKNSAAAAGTTASDFDSFNKALARHTLADDDVIASGEAIIANFGLTKKQIEDITPTIADVAAKMGTDIP
ncbi:MAG TPA: hypothetical protein VHL53_16015, partial [Acidimicrobiia bacterium]|nr:hypothetical protein [Acidimicrobiia bacterium]